MKKKSVAETKKKHARINNNKKKSTQMFTMDELYKYIAFEKQQKTTEDTATVSKHTLIGLFALLCIFFFPRSDLHIW